MENNKNPEVENNSVEIVQLKPDNWRILRQLKLKSLGAEPIAFEDQEKGMARYNSRTEDDWRKKLDEEASSTISLFAKDGDNYIGMVNGVLKLEEEKALIQHMYIDPAYRGQKIGRMLLEELIQKLRREDIKKAELAVVETQKPAIRLYESLGFRQVRTVQTKRSGETYTELEMDLEL